jgi:hypothetical protein
MATAAGSRVYIGTTTPFDTITTYETETWTEVGEVEDLGQYGDQYQDVTITTLADQRTKHFKGNLDAGTITIQCGADPTDTGQMAMTAAFASPLDYNFKVALDDKLTNSGTPTIQYFSGKVMSKRRNVGNSSNVVRQNFDVGINTEILEDPAT